jgi:hypothetical protein
MNDTLNQESANSLVGVIANSNKKKQDSSSLTDEILFIKNSKQADQISHSISPLIYEKIQNQEYSSRNLILLKTLNLAPECMKIIAEAEIKEYIRKGEFKAGLPLLESPYIIQTFLRSPEMINLFEEKIIKYAKKAWIRPIDTITDEYNMPLSILSSTKVIEAAEEGIFFCLEEGLFQTALRLYEMFPVREEAFNTPRSLSTIQQGRKKNHLKEGKQSLQNIVTALNIPLFCEK